MATCQTCGEEFKKPWRIFGVEVLKKNNWRIWRSSFSTYTNFLLTRFYQIFKLSQPVNLHYTALIFWCFCAAVSQESKGLCQSFQTKDELLFFPFTCLCTQSVFAGHNDIFHLDNICLCYKASIRLKLKWSSLAICRYRSK